MDKPTFKLVGSPCGQHGQYTFYKALKISGPTDTVIAIGEFFFVKIWQDSELLSIGELQLLWTDRVSEQTLVSLRLYFLPENTPDGRNNHGEHEVLAINEKVVLKAQDLLSWLSDGSDWKWGLKAVWKGACVPPSPNGPQTLPLQTTNLDFSDVEEEKKAVEPKRGVVVFSYSRYCRYRALLARLADIECAWLRDALVAALGGYAATAKHTDILYCRDTFEYPELEGHQFVCNQLAPKLKGRSGWRRKRQQRSQSRSNSSSDSDRAPPVPALPTTRRLSLRNGADIKNSGDEHEEKKIKDKKSLIDDKKHPFDDKKIPFDCKKLPFDDKKPPFDDKKSPFGDKKISFEDKKTSNEDKKSPYQNKKFSFEDKKFYMEDDSERVFMKKLKSFYTKRGLSFSYNLPISLLTLYTAVKSRGGHSKVTGEQAWPLLRINHAHNTDLQHLYERYLLSFEQHERKNGVKRAQIEDHPRPEKRLRTPTPPHSEPKPLIDNETGELTKDEINIISKPAEELNREFLASLPKEDKPIKISVKPVEKLIDNVYSDFNKDSVKKSESVKSDIVITTFAPPVQTVHRKGSSSLRAVRVKPGRNTLSNTSPPAPRPEPPKPQDDDIVEVPYKPRTPEIIDLDEYPEPRAPPAPPVVAPPAPVVAPPAWWPLLPPAAPLLHLYSVAPPAPPPPVQVQSSCIFGTTRPEKTVYGNPKDPFMPPPHLLHGAPIKPKSVTVTQDRHVLDLTVKATPAHKPQVEIVRVPPPTPYSSAPHDLSRTAEPKPLIPSNLEITLVSPKSKNRPPQKRSANGKFVSTPPNIPTLSTPNYARDDVSPSGSTGSRDSQTNVCDGALRKRGLSSMLDIHAATPIVQPAYVNALYAELAEQIEARQRMLCRRLFRPDGT